jgi:hypothetical protein
MLTNAQRATLLAAVPSFAPRWTAWQQDQLEYTSRFPEERLSDSDVELNFLWELAAHVAGRFTTGTNEGELAALFAALEEIYAAADAQLWSLLTLSLLEDLIMSLEQAGHDAAQLKQYIAGPLTTLAWRAAWDWMHPSAPPSGQST